MSPTTPRTLSVELPLAPEGVVDEARSPDACHREVLQLFDTCSDGLRRYVISFGVPPHAAEDIVQEAFLALFRHLTLGRPRHQLKGWLYTVAHNLALRHRERSSRRPTSEIDASLEARLSDDGPTPEDRIAERQRRHRLRAVARTLPERERRCLHLRAEGLNYREIAGTLGISLGSVFKALARAFARLTDSEAS